MKHLKLINSFSLIAIFLVSGITFGADVMKQPRRKQNRAAYRAEIDSLIASNKVPCKFSLDCEALPLGARACGGPSEFLILSKATKLKIQDALTDLTKTINELDATASQEGMVGACIALEKPELSCNSGTCAAVKK